MSEMAVMNMTEDFNRKVSVEEDPTSSSIPVDNGDGVSETASPTTNQVPSRNLSRNKSGPQGSNSVTVVGSVPRSRAPPGRSKSHKIGRPTFDPTVPAEEPVRGVNRSKSNRAKGAPIGRTRSFNGRRPPDRSSSGSSSLRARRQQQQSVAEISDDVSVTDSVFTSASIQTLDSIAVRKKQIDHNDGGPAAVACSMRGQRPRGEGNGLAIEFDESLHTVDSMHLNQKHVSESEYYDDECDDLSVFSESFGSTESCEVLSDFEEEEMGGAIVEHDDEATMKSDEDDKME
jgi:hypothetical protein